MSSELEQDFPMIANLGKHLREDHKLDPWGIPFIVHASAHRLMDPFVGHDFLDWGPIEKADG